MKNKKLTYFLLITVISLWGYLLYKVFGAVNNDQSLTTQVSATPVQMEDLHYYTVKQHDSLHLNYRDPLFVSTTVTKPTAIVEPAANNYNTVAVQHYTPPAPIVPETVISYAGLVENEKSKKKVAIVNISDKQYMIGVGENRDGVSLLEIQEGHIRINHKGKTKTIYK